MRDFLHHLFVPRHSNNHRAKLLHHQSLFVAVLILFYTALSLPVIKTNFPEVLGTAINFSAQELLNVTNEYRGKEGLSSLTINAELSKAAAEKAKHMFANDYWAHNAPDGTTPWVFIKGSGYKYVYAGENLARGFTTSEDVVKAWMTSKTHRENMLSGNYSDIGFAIERGQLNGEETILVVEMFGSTEGSLIARRSRESQPSAPDESAPQNLVAGESEKNLLSVTNFPTFDSSLLSRNIGMTTAMIFIFILALDIFVIERKKIVRFVGHSVDHLLFLGIILLVVIFVSQGVTL